MVFPSGFRKNLRIYDLNKNIYIYIFPNFLSYEPWQKICGQNEQLDFVDNK